jgi:hypothetical protein
VKPHEKIESIEDRNTRVEAEKAWEISLTRRTIITLGTYLIVGSYLTFLGIEKAWLHALVPAGAYIISMLGLKGVKKIWLNKIYKP